MAESTPNASPLRRATSPDPAGTDNDRMSRVVLGIALTLACITIGAAIGIGAMLATYRTTPWDTPDGDPHGFMFLAFLGMGAVGGSLFGLILGVILAVRKYG